MPDRGTDALRHPARLGFATSRLVRHSAERANPAAIPADAAIVLIAGDRVILRAGSGASALLDTHVAARATERGAEILLGEIEGRAVVAFALSEEALARFPEPEFANRDLRGLALEGAIPEHEIGLLATARSMLLWHGRNGFCANCGNPTRSTAGGFKRECEACGVQHFPRTDPVAIMLVRRGDRCLIGRGPHFPETMYSCLAGFVEPGETLEDAVRRETFEETGIRVGAVRYRYSQPWPFPASLMLGCVADAESETITADPAELADARWVTRAELGQMFAQGHPDGLTVPQPIAIAHHLLRDFLDAAL